MREHLVLFVESPVLFNVKLTVLFKLLLNIIIDLMSNIKGGITMNKTIEWWAVALLGLVHSSIGMR